jgi:hypothetical protein
MILKIILYCFHLIAIVNSVCCIYYNCWAVIVVLKANKNKKINV